MKFLTQKPRPVTVRPSMFMFAMRHWKMTFVVVAYLALPPIRYGVNDLVYNTTTGFGDWWYRCESERRHGTFAKDWIDMKEAWLGGKRTVGVFQAMHPKTWLKYSGKNWNR